MKKGITQHWLIHLHFLNYCKTVICNPMGPWSQEVGKLREKNILFVLNGTLNIRISLLWVKPVKWELVFISMNYWIRNNATIKLGPKPRHEGKRNDIYWSQLLGLGSKRIRNFWTTDHLKLSKWIHKCRLSLGQDCCGRIEMAMWSV